MTELISTSAAFDSPTGYIRSMGRFGATLGVVVALLVSPSISAARVAPAQRRLDRALSKDLRRAGGHDGALVVDLTAGRTLFASHASATRLPASVAKLYTTSTALFRFGPATRLSTSVFGIGTLRAGGSWHGTLFLKGGGDPTFGSAAFDRQAYGTGATMDELVGHLIHRQGIRSVAGHIVGDESYFDSLRGTPATGYGISGYVEGELSALAYNRGFADPEGLSFVPRPALYATKQFVQALRSDKVTVARHVRVFTGKTPARARLLAVVHSPKVSTLIRLTNTPSDNYFAEMLLKGIGAAFGGAGSTAAGAGVVREQMAASFGIHPKLDDGSGLSRSDATSPRDVVTLLRAMRANRPFVNSLAVAGETGTMAGEMLGTRAVGNCRGKTGTLSDVANLVGYCAGRDGHLLAFAFLMNGLADAGAGHAIEDDMGVAVASYDG
jgi:D-alanyl-D-alanine carboxypeptidase/D-alanyl-D-alanine-endopeptidase (penicillin-binding protein 4)